MLPIVKAYHALIYRPMHDLLPALRAGTNVGLKEFPGSGRHLYERLQRHPKQQAIFHDWMKTVGAQSDFPHQVAPRLAALLKDKKAVVDVGGGDATNMISLCSLAPHLKAVVFDLPGASRLARKNIREHKLSDQISTRAGDFHKDPLPRGADGMLFSHIFNIYSEEQNIRLLRKARLALNSGGIVAIFNGVTDEHKPWGLPAAHISLYFLTVASGQGMAYPIERYAGWLKQAGFKRAWEYRLPQSGHGLIFGKK